GADWLAGFVAGAGVVALAAGACCEFAGAVCFEGELPCCAEALSTAKMLIAAKITAIFAVFFIDRHSRIAPGNPQTRGSGRRRRRAKSGALCLLAPGTSSGYKSIETLTGDSAWPRNR